MLKAMPQIDFQDSTSLTDFYKSLGWNPDKSFLDPTKVVVNTTEGKRMMNKFASSQEAEKEQMLILWLNYGPKMQDNVPLGQVLLRDGWLK